MKTSVYSETSLKIDFGASKVDKIFVESGKPAPFTRIYLSDFARVMPSPKCLVPAFDGLDLG
jgi:hypothetical protein